MIKIKLNENILTSFQDFLKIKEFTDYNSQSKSIYWQHHSKQVNFFIKDKYLYIKGFSGFYLPDEKYSLRTLWRFAKSLLNKLLNYSNPYYLGFFVDRKITSAFENVMNGNVSTDIKFDKEKIITKKISHLKKIFPWKRFFINFHIVKTYYWLNILSNYLDLKNQKFIAEIGGGNGNFISLIKHHYKNKSIVDIDLPETLVHCIAYIQSIFPNAKILFPHEVKEKITHKVLEKYDFIFLTTSQINYLENNTIDVFINTGSFCEMTKEQINDYFKLIQRATRKDGFFLNVNRAEKVPIAGKKKENIPLPPINKFIEYPFFKENKILIFEICKFFDQLIKDKIYIRLEKIFK